MSTTHVMMFLLIMGLLAGCSSEDSPTTSPVDSTDSLQEQDTTAPVDTSTSDDSHMSEDDILADSQVPIDDTTGEDGVEPKDTSGPEDSETPDGADDVPTPDVIPDTNHPFPETLCGAQPFAWQPTDSVGQPVLWEEMDLSNLDADTINMLITEAGYEHITPVNNGVRNFKLRYTTQDKGELTEATAIVGIPIGIDTTSPLPPVIWFHGTNGFMDKCAPSADYSGVLQTTIVSSFGYISVAPDYIGMRGFGEPSPPGTIHPYLVGESVALSSLDALRAALNVLASDEELPSGDPQRVVLWGGSQGGHAVFFTERYAPYYAPEYTIVAAAAAVPPTDLLGQATYGTNNFGDTGITLTTALIAMRTWYGQPADMTDVITNEEPHFLAELLPELMATGCKFDIDFSDIDSLDDIYVADFLSLASQGQWDQLSPWGCYLGQNSVATSAVPRISDTPFLTTYSELDELVITAVERENIPKLCNLGYRIEYLECANKKHSQGALAAIGYMRDWVAARIAQEPWPEEDLCVITDPVVCEEL